MRIFSQFFSLRRKRRKSSLQCLVGIDRLLPALLLVAHLSSQETKEGAWKKKTYCQRESNDNFKVERTKLPKFSILVRSIKEVQISNEQVLALSGPYRVYIKPMWLSYRNENVDVVQLSG